MDGIAEKVCRYDTALPGFALLDLGPKSDSFLLRRTMIDLCDALNSYHEESTRRKLRYFWLGRFDQQTTTKFHRDNAPSESILILGYEPTEVGARLSIADHSKTAERLGISPRDFLNQHNPMFQEGERLLSENISQVTDYDPSHYQILLINNSEADPGEKMLYGVLHKAEITRANPNAGRVVNSVMLASKSAEDEPLLGEDEIDDFMTTDKISRKNQ